MTLTLAGIAGFILSIGMAVDANILIFERMKEELRGGQTVARRHRGRLRSRLAVDPRLERLDADHLRHPLLVRLDFGASIIMGFALTLAIGVVGQLFSAIVVTRSLLRGCWSALGARPALCSACRSHRRPTARLRRAAPRGRDRDGEVAP